MRLGAVLIAVGLLATAPGASAAQTPAPDPAPSPQPAPQPDPAPVEAAPSPPAPPQPSPPAPSQVDLPQASPPPVEPSEASSPSTQAQPSPRPAEPRQRPRPDRADARKVAQRISLPEPTRPFPDVPIQETVDRGPMIRAAVALLLLVIAAGASLRLTLRLAAPATILVALVMAAPAQAEDIAANCDVPSGRDGCERWYTTEWVSLTWSPDPGGLIVSGCANEVFEAETRPQRRSCSVQWGGTTESREVWIGVDRTPPHLTGIVPAWAADHRDWFNHPVPVGFQAADSISGVESCSSTTFSGPEGEAVLVPGTCRDVAGNVGAGAFPLKYDATPPGSPRVEATPADGQVSLDWSLPADAVEVEVVRIAPGEDAVLFSGQEDALVDRGLRNGVRHRYRVTAVDRAGNRTSAEAAAEPTASLLSSPAAGKRVQKPPLLTWKARRRASYYNVQLFRAGRKILSRWPKANHLQLRRSWRFKGRRHRLVPGRYVWYVWPGFGKRAERDYGRLLGRRTFVIVG